MAYTTVADVRANEKILQITDDNSPDLTNTVVTDRIARADQIVEMDLSKMVTFPLAGSTPVYVELLSNYKSTELCLVWLYTRKRKGTEEDDVEYWRQKYNDLLEKILNGEVDLGSDAVAGGTFEWTAREGVKPALGTGKWGDFQDLEELQEERPID